MKRLVTLIMILSVGLTYAQDKKQPTQEKKGDITVVTYYHDNGEIQQTGSFDSNGKLHGEWISFDEAGNKVTVGIYKNGKKDGKWFFWSGNTLREVDYLNSKIVNVNNWNTDAKVVSNR